MVKVKKMFTAQIKAKRHPITPKLPALGKSNNDDKLRQTTTFIWFLTKVVFVFLAFY